MVKNEKTKKIKRVSDEVASDIMNINEYSYISKSEWKENMLKWFNIDWYRYLFENCTGIRNFICRINGHACGVIYYNSMGIEPDMRCKNCDEDLG